MLKIMKNNSVFSKKKIDILKNVNRVKNIIQKLGYQIQIYPFNIHNKKIKCFIYQDDIKIFSRSLKKKSNNCLYFYRHTHDLIINMNKKIKIILKDDTKKSYFTIYPNNITFNTIMNSSFNEHNVYSCNIENFLGKFCFVSNIYNNTSNSVNIKKFGIYF